jgi:dTDP-4-dehydrorhamnose reductase
VRVLVTGAGGMLGVEVTRVFAEHDVIAATHERLDVTDRDAVVGSVCELQPDVIVHCGAWTAVDACESDPDKAYNVNALGTRHVSDGARRVGAYVIYVSTDYVFDGTKPQPYVEWDACSPKSVYGSSKHGGELEIDPGNAIVRTSWVFGVHGNNIVKTILRLAAGDAPLAFVDDQIGSPTCAGDLAIAIARIAGARLPGVFHATNQGVASWHEVAQEVLRAAGHDPARVAAVKTADLDPPRPAPRPANSALDNAALRLQGLPLLPHWRDAIERTVKVLAES